ncbi:lytic transglycosylase domain-containing protein [Comamonadaceae bacterium M7527]|nr:lytic transglycosylase domain-containing protein [Comamonadaceae bacterium M7527]
MFLRNVLSSMRTPRRYWLAAACGLLGAPLATLAAPAKAVDGANVLMDMRTAYYRNQSSALQDMLPTIKGHPLEPLAAYWTLKSRLEEATPTEVSDFYKAWPDSYYEDRLRNDWMLLLGKRQEWAALLEAHRHFRMNDDRDISCYVWQAQLATGQAAASGVAPALTPKALVSMWHQQTGSDQACLSAVEQLLRLGLVSSDVAWTRARDAAMWADKAAFVDAVALVEPNARLQATQLYNDPKAFLSARAAQPKSLNGNWLSAALIRLTMRDLDHLRDVLPFWLPYLNVYQQTWVNATVATREAMRLEPTANATFANTRNDLLSDRQLAWKVRAALRAADWPRVLQTIQAMPLTLAQQPVWLYWQARALSNTNAAHATHANALLQQIASPDDFYGQLAMLALGQTVTSKPSDISPSRADYQSVANNPSLRRAIVAFELGLHTEAAREWNYAVALHEPGGMPDGQLLASAEWACKLSIWDRCINTATRMHHRAASRLLYPMPFQKAVVKQSNSKGLDPAVVFGLVRQESRFVTNARSGVGASGLMQIMPATAKWTAKKIGLKGFSTRQLNDQVINLTLGTSYLKLLLDDFEASLPMAAAAYNAGPHRPRRWRGTDPDSPTLEAAIWIENIPFSETRGYVQHVLANTVNYAARITNKPQSIAQHLPAIAPPSSDAPANDESLP